MSETSKWTSIAFPREIVEAVRELIEELKYWPSTSAFCREAVLDKIKQEKKVLKELRKAEKAAEQGEKKKPRGREPRGREPTLEA